jgi:outer membrane lipoprotein SlyB
MMSRFFPLAGFLSLSLCAGCAARPVLYPNGRLQAAGQDQAKQDVDDCRRLAGEYVKARGAGKAVGEAVVGAGAGAAVGAAGGAVLGAVGQGSALGAVTGGVASLVHGIFRAKQPSPVTKNFVDRCLKERGYDVIGWE